MAIGDTTEIYPRTKMIELLASTTAANSPPSGASAGLNVNAVYSAFGCIPQTMSLRLASTAGSGAMSVTARVWGFDSVVNDWAPIGPGADSTKGIINEGQAIGESATDKIRHTELVEYVGHFSRLYLEITAIAGTSTAVTAWLVGRNPEGV